MKLVFASSPAGMSRLAAMMPRVREAEAVPEAGADLPFGRGAYVLVCIGQSAGVRSARVVEDRPQAIQCFESVETCTKGSHEARQPRVPQDFSRGIEKPQLWTKCRKAASQASVQESRRVGRSIEMQEQPWAGPWVYQAIHFWYDCWLEGRKA